MTYKCKRGILISKTPYETRYAIMEDGELAELVVEGSSTGQVQGNIYKGIVKKVIASAKLAYFDIGLDSDGVLRQMSWTWPHRSSAVSLTTIRMPMANLP